MFPQNPIASSHPYRTPSALGSWASPSLLLHCFFLGYFFKRLFLCQNKIFRKQKIKKKREVIIHNLANIMILVYFLYILWILFLKIEKLDSFSFYFKKYRIF